MNTEECVSMTEFYCPKCSCYSVIQFASLLPGNVYVTCRECDTRWRIEMEFYDDGATNDESPT